MKRSATANWKGTGKEGKGLVSTQSPLFKDAPYAYSSRFEEGEGTNPEELVAAAHASCFSMKLSFVLNKAKFTPENIDTKCLVTFDTEKGYITTSELTVSATVPGISREQFEEAVEDAKANCPISKSLKAEISCKATLL